MNTAPDQCVVCHPLFRVGLCVCWTDLLLSTTRLNFASAGRIPSSRFLLGTDDLGRDRFSRLIFGGRISLLLAPAAAALSVLLAGTLGTFAGYVGGMWERTILAIIDLFLSLPWLFLLITVRAALPLNLSPELSVMVTFLLLGLLGWAASAKVICAGVRTIKNSDF